MNICFVLGRFTRQSVGGYKMVFEYANRFVERGYTVNILFLNEPIYKQYSVLPKWVATLTASVMTQFEPRWFNLNNGVKKISSLSKRKIKLVKEADVLIATAVETVEFVMNFNIKAKKVYFIQGFENWTVSDEYVLETYNMGMKNIVVSQWLKDIVDSTSKKPSVLIKNPIDLEVYKLNREIENRKLHTIGVLYHSMPHKGFKYSLAAINKLKIYYPDLEVYMFGVSKISEELPNWIYYTCNASQDKTVEIYNKVSVWVCSTIDEGFGLTGLEAMACGCALVSTSYTGVLEYAKDGYNALLSPIKDVDALVKNVQCVFEDEELRKRFVVNAQESVKSFSWNEAVDKFEKAIS